MFMVNHLVGFGGYTAAVGNLTKGTASVAVSSTDTDTYSGGTFDGMAIGTAAADRYIIALIAGQDGDASTVSSCTVGGVALTLCHAPSTLGACAVFIGNVPTGTTANASFVFGDAQLRAGIVLLPVYGINPTVVDTADDSSDPYTVTIDCPAGGIIVGVATGNNSAAATIAWTGGFADTDKIVTDTNMEDGPISAAAKIFSAAQSGLSITATPSVGSGTDGCAFVSFGPA
jgi:hypothetical protein